MLVKSDGAESHDKGGKMIHVYTYNTIIPNSNICILYLLRVAPRRQRLDSELVVQHEIVCLRGRSRNRIAITRSYRLSHRVPSESEGQVKVGCMTGTFTENCWAARKGGKDEGRR